MKKLCTNKQTNTSQLADDRDPSPSWNFKTFFMRSLP
jgi:hypothetical protein